MPAGCLPSPRSWSLRIQHSIPSVNTQCREPLSPREPLRKSPALILTDKRIIFFDKQGATGTKMSVESINLHSIVDVRMETSGFGFDDSELTFTYIKTPYLKAHNLEYSSHKLEFPKKYNVQGLYQLLQGLAYENCVKLNQ
ncbi:MAG TPA: PH domain-containing protein [Candidatus Ventrimonas merdavium]|nr:PH domain-containing protein [Candidatus Ventrimonas merdavium]